VKLTMRNPSTRGELIRLNEIRERLGVAIPEPVTPETSEPALPAPPQELLSPPGVLGDLCDWINATAIYQQPALALANAIAAMGVVIGRRAQSETGLRTNFYTLGISESGTGKEHSRKAIKLLFHQAGMLNRLGGEDIGSDTALLNAVEKSASMLFQVDEIGRMLKAISRKQAGTHLVNIPTVLMRLYSSADSVFQGKELAGRAERQVIVQPNVGLFGTTVPSHFFDSLSSGEVGDGFLSRFLIFAGDEDPAFNNSRLSDPPESLVNAITALSKLQTQQQSDDSDLAIPDPQIVIKTPAARALFDDLRERVRTSRLDAEHSTHKSLWARTWEHADKLATLCGACHPGFTVSEDIAKWAISLAWYSTASLVGAAIDYISDNETEASVKRIARIIRDSGTISNRALTRKTQWADSRSRQQHLQTLLDSGQIESDQDDNSRQRPVSYRWIG
jgi:hypothetical protein